MCEKTIKHNSYKYIIVLKCNYNLLETGQSINNCGGFNIIINSYFSTISI